MELALGELCVVILGNQVENLTAERFGRVGANRLNRRCGIGVSGFVRRAVAAERVVLIVRHVAPMTIHFGFAFDLPIFRVFVR
jgi:hypothetical protein